jgi:hypothetical protein
MHFIIYLVTHSPSGERVSSQFYELIRVLQDFHSTHLISPQYNKRAGYLSGNASKFLSLRLSFFSLSCLTVSSHGTKYSLKSNYLRNFMYLHNPKFYRRFPKRRQFDKLNPVYIFTPFFILTSVLILYSHLLQISQVFSF